MDRLRLEAHIIPLLGARKVTALCKQDIEKMRDDVTKRKTTRYEKTGKHGVRRIKDGPGTAARCVVTFKSVLSYMQDKGVVSSNVALGVRVEPDKKREVFLNTREAIKLGERLNF